MLVDIRPFKVEEYHLLGEMRIIDSEEKVELIAGQIIKKPAKQTRTLCRCFADKYITAKAFRRTGFGAATRSCAVRRLLGI